MLTLRLVAISDLSAAPSEILIGRFTRLAQLARPHTVALLLRDHAASGRERLALGERLSAVARDHQQRLWVADRADLALLLGADALHLGEGSVKASAVRRLLPAGMRLTRAWHRTSCAGAENEAELEHVDALLLSPVMAARKGRPALGPAALTVVAAQLRARRPDFPLFALGGVSADNAEACLDAGASGVAAIGAALAPDAALVDALGIRR